MSRRRTTLLALSLGLGLAVIACRGDDDDDAPLAATQVADAVHSAGELARLVVPLQSTPDLGGMTEAQARAKKVQDAVAGFRAGVDGIPSCVNVQTDNATFLEVTFTQCHIALVFTLTGSFRADVTVETTAGIPSAVVTTMSIPSLTLTGPERSFHLEGQFVLRHPIAIAEPVTLDGELRYAIDGTQVLAMSASAEWTVVAGCVEVSGGAELTGDLLGPAGPVALSAERVNRCMQQCPNRGTVQLSYGLGSLLEWTYTGTKSVIVTGPRGRRFEVALPCGPGAGGGGDL